MGLTLVASVAKVHGGALELGDNHPGLRATMVIAAQTLPAVLSDINTVPDEEGREVTNEAAHNLRMRSVS